MTMAREHDAGQTSLVSLQRQRLLRAIANETNVVIIGEKGVGKSSLINGSAAAVTQRGYRELAKTGLFGDARAITYAITRFLRCGAENRDDLFQSGGERELYDELRNLPALIDVSGFPNENSPAHQEILLAILSGRCLDGNSLEGALELASQKPGDRNQIRDLFPVERAAADMMSHRVVFVASANKPIPEMLMELVNQAAASSGREIHVFLVITSLDLVTDTSAYEEEKARMISLLGIRGAEDMKCFEIVNYCSDTAPDRFDRNYPVLDLAYIKFLQRVSDPTFRGSGGTIPADPRGGPVKRQATALAGKVSNFVEVNPYVKQTVLAVLFSILGMLCMYIMR